MPKRKTAGELSLKAASDKSRIDPLEVGHAITDDIIPQLLQCAEIHSKIFDMPEFCIMMIIASDPLIKGIRRHKYCAFPWLPKPRPQQAVFLFTKSTQKLKRLWAMPDAKVMATISCMNGVHPVWQQTKGWCDAFYDGTFHEHIRQEHNLKMLTEAELLDVNSEKLIKSGSKKPESGFTESFDFSKIAVNKIVDTNTAILN